MSGFLSGLSAVVAFAGLLGAAVVVNLVSEEVRMRLERLPFVILRLAARRIPPELRDEIYGNTLLPELHYLLSEETGSGPITRLVAANRWALSMFVRQGGSRTAKGLNACAPPVMDGFEDIRQLPRSRRKRFEALTTRLGELCDRPAEIFEDDALARLVSGVAIACEALVNDRAERRALALAVPLIAGSHPLTRRLGHDHPAVLNLRRAHAHARLQLGHADAERLLRELYQDETRAYGHDDPRSFRTLHLLMWAVANAGRLEEAEAGLLLLEARMGRQAGLDLPLLLHVRCKRSWIQSELGKRDAAVEGYSGVIAGRSGELGATHGDTLDAMHSLGKLRVRAGEGTWAVATLARAYAERRRLQGRRHPDTLETEKYLALARFQAAGDEGAFARRRLLWRLRRIRRAQIRSREAAHPDTLDTQRWITSLTKPLETS
ncbi:hypothetical protein Ssi03_52360 [Sphaerisporangium siamense]|uniref:Tetratricopeptide repeat protein n=1 Tax=Sphaerisporangium siamense TaxID=795645 RepID=A0A7W7D881_9ACTN|nr:hypothetical protein [Sphaerisporangium siamense]MBB4702062.1 hypothetical protein [Sphaerisporangium siamense]GII87246.1 hypothetical protein Ssi03_52360 [Sphaerisporangium siamense]